MSNLLYDGVEVGAVTVKWVRRNGTGHADVSCIRHEGNPEKAIRSILSRCNYNDTPSRIVCAGEAACNLLNGDYRSATECLEKALAIKGHQPDLLLSLGGETFRVYPMKNGRICNVIPTSKCAAGTGEFIVQQFQRMGLSLAEGLAACASGRQVQLATRCSVHCKSDSTHKLNRGECTRNDIAASLVYDLARKVADMIKAAQWPTKNITICGGVSLNSPFREMFSRFFPDGSVSVLPESPYLEAYGASLIAEELHADEPVALSPVLIVPGKPDFDVLDPLQTAASLLDFRPAGREANSRLRSGGKYILGVDAGSTTTKAVLIDVKSSTPAAHCYLRTHGNPVKAVKNCLTQLLHQAGGLSIQVIQVAVTGSGREVVSVFLENCESYNEILAHARAAAAEVPEVGTVLEIGGQDSKFIAFAGGIPVDYAMNEGCSAGTGSFLEESALVDMQIEMTSISDIAANSKKPIAFGERCAAFINTDLRNALQQGAAQEDVVAGLVYAIADNYLSRIVGSRSVQDSILFQGGLALNRSVGLALAHRLRRKIVVPSYPELMGCVGSALMVQDRLKDGRLSENHYDLEKIHLGDIRTAGTFTCKSCKNYCEIKNITVRNQRFPFGGNCSRFENTRRNRPVKEGRNLIETRNRLMFETYKPEAVPFPRGTIGLPLTLSTYALYPFYARLITGFGYQVVLSAPESIREGTNTAICYPGQLMQAAVEELLNQEVDHILLPRLIEMAKAENSLHGYVCPSTTSIPDIIKSIYPDAAEKILAPHIGLSTALTETTLAEIKSLAGTLGITRKTAGDAFQAALTAYEDFLHDYIALAKTELVTVNDEPTVVIAGRPYVTSASGVNLSLPQKITSRGYHAVPADMVAAVRLSSHARDVWHFTQQINSAINYAEKRPNWHMCLVSCFSCGPDSVMYHQFRKQLEGHPFCYLEIDSHTAHAGFDTRVGAFLDIIEERLCHATAPPSLSIERLPNLTAKRNGYMPARIADDGNAIIDSDGNRIDYHDPRVVFVHARAANRFEIKMLEVFYTKRGRNIRCVDRPDIHKLRQSKKMCSGRECLPFASFTGAVLQDIETCKHDQEVCIYPFLDQEGPCQNAFWPVLSDLFTKRLQIRNVLCGLERTKENNFLGFSLSQMLEDLNSMMIGDLFEEAENTLRCLAVDQVSAIAIFNEAIERFHEALRNDTCSLEAALTEWSHLVAGIELKASVAASPKVLIFGGLNVAYVYYPVSEYFIARGVIPKVVDAVDGISMVFSEDLIRTMFKNSIVHPEEQFSHSPRHFDSEDQIRVRSSLIRLRIIQENQKKMRTIMRRSGLLFDREIPFADLLRAAHGYISHIGFSEAAITVGKFVCASQSGIYDGLVNLGCFNCQPTLNAQAIIRPLANGGNIPYIAIDCEGPWLSQNQRELLETVVMQAKRIRFEKHGEG